MVRVKAKIAYDGTSFYGWQIQKNYPSIQSTIEGVLQKIYRKPVEVTGAGRTDSGVHAFEQVAHFDWEHSLELDRLILAVNGNLPPAIRVLSLQEATRDFHARFDARSKVYLYRINRNRITDPFSYPYSLHCRHSLDLELLRSCAKIIEGEHDFAAFQAAGTDIVKTVRTVFSVEVSPAGGPQATPLLEIPESNFLYVRIHANGFLRKMVRFVVGTLIEIASSRRPLEDLARALETGERQYVGIPAPARGLFLEKVYYLDSRNQ